MASASGASGTSFSLSSTSKWRSVTVVPAGPERQRVWSLADRVFPTFERYRREAAAAGRTIPIVQLELHP